MFTIIWNSHSFHVVDKLRNNVKMNSDYFMHKNLKSAWTSDLSSRKGGASKTNCGSYRQLLGWHESGFDILARRTQHALYATRYSLDLTSSNFYLFPTMKENSKGFRYVKMTSFWTPARDSSRKPRYWRLSQIINIFHIYLFIYLFSYLFIYLFAFISSDITGARAFGSDNVAIPKASDLFNSWFSSLSTQNYLFDQVIRLFIHLLICSFIYSFIHLFTHSLIHSLTCSLGHPTVMFPRPRALARSF
jgi:hypothetical protein